MSATTLRSDDDGYLLGVLAAGIAASTDQVGTHNAKRELIRVFGTANLLVPTGPGGGPLTVPTNDGEALLTFTDSEALSAYFRTRALTSVAADGADWSSGVVGEPLASESSVASLRETGQHPILLNPAGPFGTVIAPRELAQTRPRRFLRPPSVPVPEFLDPSSREAARVATRNTVSARYAALADGDVEAYQRLVSPDGVLDPVFSLETTAASSHLTGLRRLVEGEERDGIIQCVYAALSWGQYGYPEWCVDAILAVGDRLIAAARDESPAPEWATDRLRATRVTLKDNARGRRREEVDRFIASADELAPEPVANDL